MSDDLDLKNVIEGVLCGVGRPLKLNDLTKLFADTGLTIDKTMIRGALHELETDLEGRGIELREVASGFRLQVRSEYASYIALLLAEKPARYSRALLETLVLVAYRQPVTRGEIEDVRGVSVSSSIMKTLQERNWIRVLGHRDVPGRPAMYGTTKTFLDDFNLQGLEDLPPLAQVRDIDKFHSDLFTEQVNETRVNEDALTQAGQGDADGSSLETEAHSQTDSAALETNPQPELDSAPLSGSGSGAAAQSETNDLENDGAIHPVVIAVDTDAVDTDAMDMNVVDTNDEPFH
ncbi:MAG: SMC-Scp complex subunit ScpB [Gammaproteobacteria bacterium]|nr:SMC-Scp complex subunit ScpB [Gammaproteobacteria bacterium]